MTTMYTERWQKRPWYSTLCPPSNQSGPTWIMYSTSCKSSQKPKIRRSKSIWKSSPLRRYSRILRSKWSTKGWRICWRASRTQKRRSSSLKRRRGRMSKRCCRSWTRPRPRGLRRLKIAIIRNLGRYALALKQSEMPCANGGSYGPSRSERKPQNKL